MPRPDRPRIHFTARRGWINDPLGLTWRDGRYHLFFQHVPDRVTWAPGVHWGHATSPDLLTWEEQPVALSPGDGDDGVWSGNIVTDVDGRTFLFFTSVLEPDLGHGRVRVARPLDDEWTRWEKGPVVVDPSADMPLEICRDPFVFRDGPVWRMLVGASLEGGVAAALSYSSTDLLEWRSDGVAAQRPASLREPVWTGSMWECPQLVEIDGSHVLITSVWHEDVLHHVAYGVGTWSGGVFTARTWGRLSFGDSYYAPSVFHDEQGRPGLIFWLRGAIASDRASWSGALSAPHLLELDGDRLIARVHPRVREAVAGDPDLAAPVASSPPALFQWHAEDPRSIVVQRDGLPDVAIVRTAGAVSVHTATQGRVDVPSGTGAIELLVDGPVVELSTDRGVIALT